MEQGNDNQLEQSTTTVDNGIVDSQAAENKDEGAVSNSFYVVLLDLNHVQEKINIEKVFTN